MSEQTCPECGGPLHVGDFPFCHGDASKHQPISLRVVDDTYLGGLTVVNLGPDPVTFSSRTAHKAYLKRHGLVNRVEHIPMPGSDKSPETQRFV